MYGPLNALSCSTFKSFANHVYRFDSLDCSPRGVKEAESLHRSNPSSNCPMVLLHHIVEISERVGSGKADRVLESA
jgi:hypothetical protein